MGREGRVRTQRLAVVLHRLAERDLSATEPAEAVTTYLTPDTGGPTIAATTNKPGRQRQLPPGVTKETSPPWHQRA